MKLTDLAIRAMKAPESGATIVYDDSFKGFGVRISQGGTKTFVLTYGKNRKRVTIGRHGIISLSEARDKARAILALRTLKPDEAPEITFEEARKLFVTHHLQANTRPRTAQETERLLTRHFASIEDRNLSTLKAYELAAIVDKIKSPSVANHAFTAIRTLLRWSVRRRYIEHSPLEGLKLPHKTTSRVRVLSDTELYVLFNLAYTRGTYGTIIQLLILTGQRLGQIAALDSSYVTEDTITWPGALMKGGVEHSIPLTPTIKALLPQKTGLLFPTKDKTPWNTWSKPKSELDKLVPFPHWTLHDIRRSLATGMASIGIQPHLIERILAHTQGELSPIALVYNKHRYLTECRDALLKWERHALKLDVPEGTS